MYPSPVSLLDERRLGSEMQLASLACGMGLIWSAQAWSSSFLGFRAIELTPGPLELCCLGLLHWLWARWIMVCNKRKQAERIAVERS